MTYKEKWEAEHTNRIFKLGPAGCPSAYGYCPRETVKEVCKNMTCIECWNREIPEAAAAEGLIAGINDTIPEITRSVEQLVKEAKVKADEFLGIKDSGDRTEFESGAVRDMREGKGRFDLVPLEVVAEYINRGQGNPKTEERYWFFLNIARFQRTNDTSFLYSAMAVFDASAFRYTTEMLLEVSKHFEEGAKKYGESNWQRGIPTWCYIDSAVRHYIKWLDGQTDERHDRAVMWNLMCCIWEVDYREDTKQEETE